MKAAVAWCVVQLCRAYFATLRVRAVLPDGRVISPRDYPIEGQIYAICERDTIALAKVMWRRRFAVLVAPGRDGDWATALLTAFGCRVVRGATRRGGASALRRLVRHARESNDPVAIVVDGPLGPAGVAKPGAVMCGRRSGRRVQAVGVLTRAKLTLPRTWSGIYLPLPFSTVWATYETACEPGATAESVSTLTARLTEALASTRARLGLRLARERGGRGVKAMRATLAAATLARDAVLAALALPFLGLLWALPWRAALFFGRCYGYAAWCAMPETRRVGMINLRRALGVSLSRVDARRAVREVFANLGQSLAEGFQFARRYRRAPEAAAALYEIEDPALERRLLAEPRARIFVTGHLGSWEVCAALAAQRTGRAASVVARRIDNPFLNLLWRHIRVRDDSRWIDKRGAAGEALARLRRGEDVAMLVDEHAGPRGVFVPFFGTAASTRKTPAVLSLASGAPIVLGACVRRPGRPFLYRLAVLEPQRHLPPDEAIRDLTARMTAIYETWIRDAPLQWRWIHWRWKARPDGSEERYGRRELRLAFSGHVDRPALVE